MSNYNFAPTLDGLNNIDGNNINSNTLITDYLTVNLGSSVPTADPSSNNNTIASTAYVTNAISNTSSNYVDLTSQQTITGEKTFSNTNTKITGNTVTNSIQSPDPTTNINIGTQLTTGDINLGTTFIGPSMGVALNWGTSSNTGQLSLNGGSFNLNSSGVYTQRSGPTFGMNMADNQTSGIFNMAHKSDRTGAININTGGTSTAPLNISSGTTVNAPIIIGSASSTTQTATHNAITTFTKIPQCSITALNPYDLVNKDYVDNKDFVTLTGPSQTITGEKVYTNTNLFLNDNGTNSNNGFLAFQDSAGDGAGMYYNNDDTDGVGGLRIVSSKYGFAFSSTTGAGEHCDFLSEDINFRAVEACIFSEFAIPPPTGGQKNQIKRGAIYDKSSSLLNPVITFQNGQATDIGVTFNALNVFVPIGNTCNMVRVSIPFNLLACSTFGLPSATATIGLRFDGFSVVYLKNGVAYTPTNNYSYSPATGTTINWNKTGSQSNVQGLASYFGNLEIAFNIDINNTSVDTYQVRINPSATITNYSINFDIFKFVCKNGTSGQTNGVSFRNTSATLYSGGTMTFAGGNPSFVDTSVTKIGLSYPTPPNTCYAFMPLNNNITPPAMISQYAGTVAPLGWLLCDGGTYNISNYGNLYAVIGNLYGGSLSAGTFSVPDTRGVFVAGNGSSTFGGKTYTRTLGTRQNDKIQQHKHTYSDLHWYDENAGGANQSIVINGANYENPSGDNNGSNTDEQFTKRLTSNTWENNVTQTNQYTDPTSGQITSNETYPANIALNYIIKW